jgi:hypothetical protein
MWPENVLPAPDVDVDVSPPWQPDPSQPDPLPVPWTRYGYTDAEQIPSWAGNAVDEATAAGLFQGRTEGRFAPGDPVTAGEMASLLDRMLDYCRIKWEQFRKTRPASDERE